ncbi:hypothetical protein [Neptunomonas antarctica]|uniref:NHL repeat-containing protein n=1 Tax=Neptunomonas antarctica TaxID=619304 RepID=A0A1N7L743_9GAMM|nr:NHL repeat-containing protein [Neptunomonas antarctica]
MIMGPDGNIYVADVENSAVAVSKLLRTSCTCILP